MSFMISDLTVTIKHQAQAGTALVKCRLDFETLKFELKYLLKTLC